MMSLGNSFQCEAYVIPKIQSVQVDHLPVTQGFKALFNLKNNCLIYPNSCLSVIY